MIEKLDLGKKNNEQMGKSMEAAVSSFLEEIYSKINELVDVANGVQDDAALTPEDFYNKLSAILSRRKGKLMFTDVIFSGADVDDMAMEAAGIK